VMSWVRGIDDMRLQRYVGPRSELGIAGSDRSLNEVMPERPSNSKVLLVSEAAS